MANQKVSALPAAGPLTGAELVPIVQGGVSKQSTAAALAATIALGAITPTSVNGIVFSGSASPTLAVTGPSTISGNNTGDDKTGQTGILRGSAGNILGGSTLTHVPSPTADYSFGSHKITNLANGTSVGDAVNFGQLSAAAAGLSPQNPISNSTVLADNLSAPPGSPATNDSYIVGPAPSGAWVGLAGRLVEWNGAAWVDVLGRVLVIGDRVGVALLSGVASGGLTGKEKNIAQFTNATPGTYAYTFTPPLNTFTTTVTGTSSHDDGHLYYYSTASVSWVDFFTGIQYTFGNGLTLVGQTITIDLAITVDKNSVQTLTNKNLTSGSNTFPTFNQNTTGSAATLTTPHLIDGISFNGSADILIIAPATHAAVSKATPVDADEMPLSDSAGSFGLKKVTWANLKATLKTYFDTFYAPTVYNPADQVITAGGGLTLAHGLGAIPKTMKLFLVCQIAEQGYNIGDITEIPIGATTGTNVGVTIVPDATNLNIRFGSAVSSILVLNKGTGASNGITNADWKLRVFAKVPI